MLDLQKYTSISGSLYGFEKFFIGVTGVCSLCLNFSFHRIFV
jgi:hypothetical protein